MARRALFAGLLCGLALSCTLGPDYKRPPVETPDHWRDMAAEEASIANLPWWELFQDETLQSLIWIALRENRDLKIAVERINEARARYGISRSQLYPEIDAGATGGALRFSDGSLTHTPPEGGADNTKQLYSVNIGMSWEIDFFGRVRRANEAERANLLATEEARRAVAITLVADVARAYAELRELDRRLEIAQRTLKSREEYVELAHDRFVGGVTSELDWRQAEAEYYRVKSIVSEVTKRITEKRNELSYLLGQNPSEIQRGRAIDRQPIPPEVPAGLPAEILDRRPDVREAEQRLVAANARIGEAKAMRFPRISLTGSYGVASTDLDDLLDSSSQSWNIFASLLQPIFNGGKNKRRVEVQRSRTLQATYDYERTLLQALREVEDALAGLRDAAAQRVAQGHRVEAERKALEISELRYRGGVATYLEVLDSQRSLFNAENDEVAAFRLQVTSLIRLYRALGGGWPTEAASEAPAPATAEPESSR